MSGCRTPARARRAARRPARRPVVDGERALPRTPAYQWLWSPPMRSSPLSDRSSQRGCTGVRVVTLIKGAGVSKNSDNVVGAVRTADERSTGARGARHR